MNAKTLIDKPRRMHTNDPKPTFEGVSGTSLARQNASMTLVSL